MKKIHRLSVLYGILPYNTSKDDLISRDKMATTRPDKNTVLKRTEKKNERLEIRSTSSQKSIIEKAASLMGESTTSFLLSSALRDALQVIQDHQVTELSLNDWNRFSEILESDSAPTSELKIAKRLHKKHVVNSDGV